MGVFDEIRCRYPLPVPGANDLAYQTKDTDAQFLDNYEIREDGTLWHETYRVEDRSDPTKPGLLGMAGCMTRIPTGWEPADHEGELYFYTITKDGEWLEFVADFMDGRLRAIDQVFNRG